MNPFAGGGMPMFSAGSLFTVPMFSAGSLFTAYASLTTFFTLIQQFYHQFIPKQVRQYITEKLEQWFKSSSSTSSFTLVIERFDDGDCSLDNQVYDACVAYLSDKLKSVANRLKVIRLDKKDQVSFKLAQGEIYSEQYAGVQLQWEFISNKKNDPNDVDNRIHTGGKKYYFELSFNHDHKDKVFDSYLPFVLKLYDNMMKTKKDLWLNSHGDGIPGFWNCVKFRHPFTFDILAMDPELKRIVIDDLDRFMRRKEFYKKVGRAWKRGYLLYGPPGTGKSSLIAAMANYLKFDIYDLQLSTVLNDTMLRRLLLSTKNKSILVIEDIDCGLGLGARGRHFDGEDDEGQDSNSDQGSRTQISLSGLLNFIDGLWSSCGDERIFIFTTNYKDRLDPALLRPGRMDMHIHMSYLTMPAFRVLASNYLNISGEHCLFGEIEELIKATDVTPAQVAEELIRSDDPNIALSSLIQMLKGKNSEQDQKKKQEEK